MRIPSKESDWAGPYRSENSPCFEGPLKAFTDPSIDQITIVTSTQVGKTLTEMLCAMYAVDQNPGRMVWVMAREEDVKALIEERFKPIIQASPELKKHKAHWRKNLVSINDMTIHIAWAGSEAAVQSWPCQYVIMDELSSWKPNSKQANPVKSAKQRTIMQSYPKVIAVSTPKVPGDLIWSELLHSDFRKCYVPCPHCGQYQTLEFDPERLVIPHGETNPARIRKLQLASYHCKICAVEITERERRNHCIPNYVWVPKGCSVNSDGEVEGDAEISDHAGYHLSAFYSLAPQVTFSRIAAEYLMAGRTASGDGMKSFFNLWLGLPYEDSTPAPKEAQLLRCIADHAEGEVPAEVRELLMGVDLGGQNFHFVVRGYGYQNKSWLIESGELRSWEEVEELLEKEWTRPDGSKIGLSLVLMDEGHRTDEVIAFCREHFGFVLPIKGKDTFEGVIRIVSPEQSSGRSKTAEAGLTLIRVNTDFCKTAIQSSVRKGERGGWHIHRDPGQEYRNHMQSEKRVMEKTGSGNPKPVWKASGANHMFDCEVYVFAGAEYLQFPYLYQGDPPSAADVQQVDRGGDSFEEFDGQDWSEDYDDWS